MVTVVYFIIVVVALLLQVAFTFLYWRWIPAWIRNPYGRLAQLDSFSQMALYIIFLVFLALGAHWGVDTKRLILAFCFAPFILLGCLRIALLKRAKDSADEDKEVKK